MAEEIKQEAPKQEAPKVEQPNPQPVQQEPHLAQSAEQDPNFTRIEFGNIDVLKLKMMEKLVQQNNIIIGLLEKQTK